MSNSFTGRLMSSLFLSLSPLLPPSGGAFRASLNFGIVQNHTNVRRTGVIATARTVTLRARRPFTFRLDGEFTFTRHRAAICLGMHSLCFCSIIPLSLPPPRLFSGIIAHEYGGFPDGPYAGLQEPDVIETFRCTWMRRIFVWAACRQ